MSFPIAMVAGVATGIAATTAGVLYDYFTSTETTEKETNKEPTIANATKKKHDEATRVALYLITAAEQMIDGDRPFESIKIEDHVYLINKNKQLHLVVGAKQNKMTMKVTSISKELSVYDTVEFTSIVEDILQLNAYVHGK